MSPNPLRKPLWTLLGCLSLALGLIGIVTPLLPTTVFLLMAAACFARGNPQWEQRLLAHPTFGPPIRDWRAHHGMRRNSKRAALLAIALSFCTSIALLMHSPPLQVMLALLGLALAAWILHLPTITSDTPHTAASCTLRQDRPPLPDELPGP